MSLNIRKKTLWPELPPYMTFSVTIKTQDRNKGQGAKCYISIRVRAARSEKHKDKTKEFPVNPDTYKDQYKAACTWLEETNGIVGDGEPLYWDLILERLNVSQEVKTVKQYTFRDLRE